MPGHSIITRRARVLIRVHSSLGDSWRNAPEHEPNGSSNKQIDLQRVEDGSNRIGERQALTVGAALIAAGEQSATARWPASTINEPLSPPWQNGSDSAPSISIWLSNFK